MSHFNDIKEDVLYLSKTYYRIGHLISACVPRISKKIIGTKRCGIIKSNKYVDAFDSVIDEGLYFLRFADDSLITMHYCFDSNGNVTNFSLSFLPYYDSSIFLKDDNFNDVLSKCIRIDYDPLSYKGITHSKIHFHTSFFNNGLRLPITDMVYPSEFLYIILLFFYDHEYQPLFKHCDNLHKNCIPISSLEKKIISLKILRN